MTFEHGGSLLNLTACGKPAHGELGGGVPEMVSLQGVAVGLKIGAASHEPARESILLEEFGLEGSGGLKRDINFEGLGEELLTGDDVAKGLEHGSKEILGKLVMSFTGHEGLRDGWKRERASAAAGLAGACRPRVWVYARGSVLLATGREVVAGKMPVKGHFLARKEAYITRSFKGCSSTRT